MVCRGIYGLSKNGPWKNHGWICETGCEKNQMISDVLEYQGTHSTDPFYLEERWVLSECVWMCWLTWFKIAISHHWICSIHKVLMLFFSWYIIGTLTMSERTWLHWSNNFANQAIQEYTLTMSGRTWLHWSDGGTFINDEGEGLTLSENDMALLRNPPWICSSSSSIPATLASSHTRGRWSHCATASHVLPPEWPKSGQSGADTGLVSRPGGWGEKER